MRKLLRAGFSRLCRDKVFWISVILMLIYGIVLPVIHYIDNVNNMTGWTWDSTLFSYVMWIPILLSLTTAFFIGCEYSDGTMRNKLIAGHYREHIYLANMIVSVSMGIVLSIAFFIPYTCIGIPLLGVEKKDCLSIIIHIGLNVAVVTVFSAIFTCVTMLCQNKAYAVAGCILLTFILLFFGVHIISSLNEPEYYDAYSYTENGVTVEEAESKNPNYLSGTKRKVYEFLYDFTPGGQVLQIGNMNAEKPVRLVLYDVIIGGGVTGCGVMLFRRKDLR